MTIPKNASPADSRACSRRRFLASATGAVAGFHLVSREVLGGPGKVPPSEKLHVACVGLGAMGTDDLKACEDHEVVALCDVDWSLASVTFQRYPDASKHRDYRRMLEQQKDIDAVIVATPDHTHGVISAAAMRLGKHVYTQMPLTHDVWEARQLAKIARETGVATQMGNGRYSGPTLRTAVEWLQDGCIGPVHDVSCWTCHPRWPQGRERPQGASAVPESLDWDLWLGPAPERPYHTAYAPYNWRGWRDFGTGALGALGCHEMDGVYWALKLAEAKTFTVEAESAGGTSESYPRESTIRYRFPARGNLPPVTLTWYDGGRRPPRPEEWPGTREFLGSNGTIFTGEKGKLTFGALTAGTGPGQAGPRFIPESLSGSYRKPRQTIPRIKSQKGRWVKAGRHVEDWLRACQGERPACSRFEISAPLTEIVLLGNVALACGEKIEWDRDRLEVTNVPEANRYVRREYREGWSL